MKFGTNNIKIVMGIIDKHENWEGHRCADVQKFIKDNFEKRIGIIYYDVANSRYLAFADEENRDLYLNDTTKTDLILGTFDAPFRYSASITLLSSVYNAVPMNSGGHYVEFTFDIKNENGQSVAEDVIINYTITRGGTKIVITEQYRQGAVVRFNVDKYLAEGTNNVTIGIIGKSTLAATTMSVTYLVVDLKLEDEVNISKVYDISKGAQILEVPFSVSGHGTKIVEWYLDGVLLPFVKVEDEVVESYTQRVKYIELANLQQGTHSLQIRAYTTVDGEKFYTDTHYREIIVYTNTNKNNILALAMDVPSKYGVIESPVLYDITQYVPYTLRFAIYSPKNLANVSVDILLDDVEIGNILASNDMEFTYTLIPPTSGNKILSLKTTTETKEIPMQVAPTTMQISEITSGLALDFSAVGRSNTMKNHDKWTSNGYTATFNGFNWNETSGWVNNRLKMNAGSSFGINYAPLSGAPTETGRTIEIEFCSTNVTNDDAILCDMRNANGTGLIITATKVRLLSANGVAIETEYKAEENVRVTFVINRAYGSTRKNLTLIYANGCVSRCVNWASTDNYATDSQILFNATEEAELEIKAIRVYNIALTDDQVLNNFTLYRDTIEEMLAVYNRNNVYAEGSVTFSPDKMSSRLPIMTITGDIPTLENTSDKDTQIIVDIEYTNLQDPSRSFKMVGAAMRPQGTSSMGYPKKNFRIYTRKVSDTILYDAEGKVVADKLYSFKKSAIPVDCWCLKADYAESSGVHNTGIARMWNNALLNAQVDGEYVFRTGAQKSALEAGYEYDVRTTIDGFPILLFYKPTANDEPIFIGKYNFNNDKSTESVFGFVGIPNFDNTRMQCWELLNNGNALGLFTSVENFDTKWSEAFESRYPDTKTPNTSDLKAFCTWMSSVTQDDFLTEKWEHLNVWMVAAYYCYLMRHAAADQFVKNAMLTSEDGEHFYFILYDNDTINGLINSGDIDIAPTDDRNSVDKSGVYKFAGHDSRLWNMLEADPEFMYMVKTADNALYSAGISYANAIKVFDQEQADKWVERVYNQDSEYKYISPFVNSGINNLFMLQGKRDLHRRWWLSKRFSLYDSKFVSGEYKSQAVELKCQNDTPEGQQMIITAGYPMDYGFGINNLPRVSGVALEVGESYMFTTTEKVNLGDPLRIYGAPNLAELDLSEMMDRLAVVTITNVYTESLGTKLKKFILGNSSKDNMEVQEISGLKMAKKLEYLDVQRMKGITSLDLSEQKYLKTLKAFGSNVASVKFATGAMLENLELASAMRVLELEQLPYLTTDGLSFEDITKLSAIKVTGCKQVSNDISWVLDWYRRKATLNKDVTLIMDNIQWNCSADELIDLGYIQTDGGVLDLKGTVTVPSMDYNQAVSLLELFGDNIFSPTSALYINAPAAVFIVGKEEILEGESENFSLITVGKEIESVVWSMSPTSSYVTLDAESGRLTTIEGMGSKVFTINAKATTKEGEKLFASFTLNVSARTYPTADQLTLKGSPQPDDGDVYTLESSIDYTGDIAVAWSLTGDITEYAGIEASNMRCTFRTTQEVAAAVFGAVQAVVTKQSDGSTIATKTLNISLVNENVAEVDAAICQAFHDAGYTSSPTYITKQEAANISNEAFQEITFSSLEGVKSFNGFKYFTRVTTLKDEAFSRSTIESITFPSSLTSIGNRAFYLCYYLKEVDIPEGVLTLGQETFSNCEGLQSVKLPSKIHVIPQHIFYGCTALTNINIPYGVTEIEFMAFNDCASLQSVEIPKSVTKIGSSAFANTGLTSINIPEGITVLNSSTFSGCRSLTSVTIPNSVTSIGDSAFYNCSSLPYVNIPEDVKSLGKNAFYGCTSLTSVTIPNGVTAIGDYAFANCSGLTSITIPDSVTSIGEWAFNDCTNLSAVNLGNGFPSYRNSWFQGCVNLEFITIAGGHPTYDSRDNCNAIIETSNNTLIFGCKGSTVPNSVTSIGNSAFANCSGLTSITIPDSVMSINNNAFYRCSGLTSVTIGSGVTSIGVSAFWECTSLTSIIIPDGVTGISNQTFSGCSSLTSVTIPNSVTSIGNMAFSNCGLTSVTIPNSVTSIGNMAFIECFSLTSVTIPDSVMSIGNDAFNKCTSLTTIKWGVGVTSLGQNAFLGCTSLSATELPDSILTMGSNCFSQSGLTSLRIPTRCTKIPFGLFTGCTSLISVELHDKITTIGKRAFWDCISLTSIEIPDSVTSFADNEYNWQSNKHWIFQNCTSLEKVVIGNGLSTIPPETFYNCSKLKDVTISDSVTSIGDYAFNATAIISLPVTEHVTNIGNGAFAYCQALTDVEIPSSVQTIGNYVFRDCGNLKSVIFNNPHVPEYALYNCRQVTSVTFNEGVQIIEKSACCSLQITTLNIPNSVTTIKSEAFRENLVLHSITIGNGITSIGSRVFLGCNSVDVLTMKAPIAPTLDENPFSGSNKYFMGYNSRGSNIFYVPSGSTGYDTGYWLDPLQNAAKCGFTLSATL
jgi:hypothetical protein